jgi:hypothetical protein
VVVVVLELVLEILGKVGGRGISRLGRVEWLRGLERRM